MSRTAISPTRSENFADWYQQVIQAADLAEHSSVRGCMVIKPYGYAIWENIQNMFNARLKQLNVQNAYFPLLIPVELLSKEAEHIEGFATECAVVTHHRLRKNDDGVLVPDGELNNPYVIRPTSEVIIGHTICKWINTYRDLPLKINQWCNVMRWEMRPRLFLRTSEFLWQEGHAVFETAQEAQEDAITMLQVYKDFITQHLAMPVISGEKTDEERFPGAINTYTIEAMMQDGKALQAGTSHYLGQTFSNAFNIKYLGKDGKEAKAHTTSWGISTRLIGGIIMSHADDDGLVLPPSIAPYQVVVIPIIHDQSKRSEIMDYCSKLKEMLLALGIRIYIDITDHNTSNKIWKWIKCGVPIRLEIGAKELSESSILVSRRDMGKEGKRSLPINAIAQLSSILREIHDNMLTKATLYRDSKMQCIGNMQDLDELFSSDFKGFASMQKSMTDIEEFAMIAKKHSLTRRCIPKDERNVNTESVLIAKAY